VKEVAVVGRPDPKWDERPHAEVVLRDGFAGKVSERDLGKYLHTFIDSGAIHKRAVLTEIRLADAIPKTSVGKLDKKALRAQLKAATAARG
jgi:fatty-acyl-CoA synthase